MPQKVPSRFVSDTLPIWVSARAMTLADGSVDWSLVRAAALFSLAEGSDTNCERAEGLIILRPPGHREPSSLAELAQQSTGVFEGRVVGVEPGAYTSIPGVLLEVAVDAWLHADAAEQLDRLYIFYPGGSFRLGPHRVCAGNFHLSRPPAIGDRLLVALTSGAGPHDDLGMIFAPGPKELFVERADGTLEFSSDWRGEHALDGISTLDELRTMFRRSIRAHGTAERSEGP